MCLDYCVFEEYHETVTNIFHLLWVQLLYLNSFTFCVTNDNRARAAHGWNVEILCIKFWYNGINYNQKQSSTQKTDNISKVNKSVLITQTSSGSHLYLTATEK